VLLGSPQTCEEIIARNNRRITIAESRITTAIKQSGIKPLTDSLQ
jgi:hypothetical protein